MSVLENSMSEELLSARLIQRRVDGQTATLKDMGVDHGGTHVFVAEEFLNSSNIVTILQQMRGEAVAQGMTADPFGNPGFLSGSSDDSLQGGGIKMMAAFMFTAGIR